MKDSEWFSGSPPSCGWWPASLVKNSRYLRWWNGKFWSRGALSTEVSKFAAFQAKHKSIYTGIMQWQHRPKSWPKESFT